jgi:FMN phosphatase YigB (HAD superfamily)
MSLATVKHVFLDFDRVINDDQRMNREAVRLIAERMTQEHGGSAERWLEAVRMAYVTANRWAGSSALREGDVPQWLREYDRVWLEELFRSGGLEVPSEGGAELGWQIREEAYRNVSSIYPEAPRALALLKGNAGRDNGATADRSRILYVASGGRRARLDAMLTEAGLRHFFSELFGCDTVNIVKESAEYYRRIFRRLALPPRGCVVVDDNPHCIRFAQEAAARAILLDRTGSARADWTASPVASDLTEVARQLMNA